MVRDIVRIDAEKCDGCGVCVDACHEKAIELRGGRAYLTRDDYCDGLGACLPACPRGAIAIEKREACSFDAAAAGRTGGPEAAASVPAAALANWPVQLQLTPPVSARFAGACLLISADCCAFAGAREYAAMLPGKMALIACPKLDAADYTAKLTEIFSQNSIRSVDVLRMEVPCCGGIVWYVRKALEASGKRIPCRVYTFSVQGGVRAEAECLETGAGGVV